MKICRKCGLEKSIDSFYFNATKKRHDGMCSDCHKDYRKKHYIDNKQYYINKARKHNDVYFERNKQIVLDMLKNGCIDCGEKDIIVLQFDHLRDKKYHISGLMESSELTLKNELDKCEVRCANCHMRKTASRSGDWWKSNVCVNDL